MRPRRREHRRESGFTLQEVLVTIAVTAIGMTGVLALQLGTTRANVDTQAVQLATEYAQELLEEVRQAEWIRPCAMCDAQGCDGSSPGRSVDGKGCEAPTAAACATRPPSASCCDRLAHLACDYARAAATRPDVTPNSASACDDTGAVDPTQQTCDGLPPNPTGITFQRWIEVEDVPPPPTATDPTITLRRVKAVVEWQDAASETRGMPHRVALETMRRRQ